MLKLVSRGFVLLLVSCDDIEAPDDVLESLTDHVLDVLDLFGFKRATL